MGRFLQHLGLMVMVAAFVWSAVVSWSYPDATDRRMWIDHWPQMLGIAGTCLVGLGISVLGTLRKD